jgi:predicted lipid-binding transport protein (Tim44 family)
MGDGFQFIDIIFFAMIAAFLVLRLRGVLGRRDGHEGDFRSRLKDDKDKNSDDNVVKLSEYDDDTDDGPEDGPEDGPKESEKIVVNDDDPLSGPLAAIQAADPDFAPDDFLSGAQIAFEIILGAYADGNAGALKPMLNAEVYTNFSKAIQDRELAGETLEDTLIGIKSAEIVEAEAGKKMTSVTVKFVSEQINATRDEDGTVVDGNPTTVIEVTDFWTFSHEIKSRDPNWTLTATSSLD